MWERFKGGRDNTVWFYEGVLSALQAGAKKTDPPMLEKLVAELDRTFARISTFVSPRWNPISTRHDGAI